MKAGSVLELLDVLRTAGVEAWVDGGWGIDALVGRETRPHEDLDLVVALEHVGRIQEVFGLRGFTLVEDHLPIRFVLSHPHLGHVDSHTVVLDKGGGGLQPQLSGKTFRYPPEGFVLGRIAGQEVGCISAEVQVLCHRGYEPKAKDVHDLLALHRAFGIDLPGTYRDFLKEPAI